MGNWKKNRVPDEVAPKVKARLRALRTKEGWSKRETARMIGEERRKMARGKGLKAKDIPYTDASTVGRYEGQRPTSPPLDYVEAAAKVFGIPLSVLVSNRPHQGNAGKALLRALDVPEETIQSLRSNSEQVRTMISAAVNAAEMSSPAARYVVDELLGLLWLSLGWDLDLRGQETENEVLARAGEWARYLEFIRSPPDVWLSLGLNPPAEVWEEFWMHQILALRLVRRAAMGEGQPFIGSLQQGGDDGTQE